MVLRCDHTRYSCGQIVDRCRGAIVVAFDRQGTFAASSPMRGDSTHSFFDPSLMSQRAGSCTKRKGVARTLRWGIHSGGWQRRQASKCPLRTDTSLSQRGGALRQDRADW